MPPFKMYPRTTGDFTTLVRDIRHSRKHPGLIWAFRYAMVVLVIAVPLSVPVILFRDDSGLTRADIGTEHQYHNLMFYLFLWLLISVLAGVVGDLIGVFSPYIFRISSRYINPAHHRYWRLIRVLRRPLCFVCATVSSWISFDKLINHNPLLVVNFDKNFDFMQWDDIIDDILQHITLWVAVYVLEKILVLYITVHYHSRSYQKRIDHSKDLHNALISLYEASLFLHPLHSGTFAEEDLVIRNSTGTLSTPARIKATSYLAKLGIDGYRIADFFGNYISNDTDSHWLRPSSSYATVERALASPSSAAALARRLWKSFAVKGSEWLRAEDIVQVLGTHRRTDAFKAFEILDENEAGDIRLDEMVMTLIGAGKVRRDIYRNMSNMNHCINAFDWVCLSAIACVMIFFVVVLYVPRVKELQQTVSMLAIGLGFAAGNTVNHFLAGTVFLFFDHPFDVGDRVEVWNPIATVQLSLFVKRQSLLYTVFTRLDNGADYQVPNEMLATFRTENFSRARPNRQNIDFAVDWNTTWKDLVALRTELQSFLTAPENRRQYFPKLIMQVTDMLNLNRIEIKITVTHKSNFTDEELRVYRSNRMFCALIAALKKCGIHTPWKLGDQGRPQWNVHYPGVDSAPIYGGHGHGGGGLGPGGSPRGAGGPGGPGTASGGPSSSSFKPPWYDVSPGRLPTTPLFPRSATGGCRCAGTNMCPGFGPLSTLGSRTGSVMSFADMVQEDRQREEEEAEDPIWLRQGQDHCHGGGEDDTKDKGKQKDEAKEKDCCPAIVVTERELHPPASPTYHTTASYASSVSSAASGGGRVSSRARAPSIHSIRAFGCCDDDQMALMAMQSIPSPAPPPGGHDVVEAVDNHDLIGASRTGLRARPVDPREMGAARRGRER